MKRRLVSIIVLCLMIIAMTGCACSSSSSNSSNNSNLANDAYITGDFSKFDKDYVRNTGLIFGDYEIVLPAKISELPFNNHTKAFEVKLNNIVPDDSRIKPNQIIMYNPSDAITSSERKSNGTYYAFNDTAQDNLPELCNVYAVVINTKDLDDNNYIQIGPNRITKNMTYKDVCITFRNTVNNQDSYKENLYDNKDKYSVVFYNDLLYKIVCDKLDENNAVIVIRADKDINDANNLNDIPWSY